MPALQLSCAFGLYNLAAHQLNSSKKPANSSKKTGLIPQKTGLIPQKTGLEARATVNLHIWDTSHDNP